MKEKKQKNQMKELFEKIEIPAEISAVVDNNEITMKKGDKEIMRKIITPIIVEIQGNSVLIKSTKSTKRERKVFGSMKAHINNMIKGLNEGFKYRLQIASVHFPITAKVDKEKNEFVVKNFLGEKKDRVVKLVPGVKIDINKDIIELESPDIEKAGMLASKIEKETKIRFRDRRVFQDGIFIIQKPGRSYL